MINKERYLNGYKLILKDGHPNSMTSENWNGWIYEHIYLMSEHIGRPLNENEVVHHLDENKSNNKLENLVLLNNNAHSILHNMLRKSIDISEIKDNENYITIEELTSNNEKFNSVSEEDRNKINNFYINIVYRPNEYKIVKRKKNKSYIKYDDRYCLNEECSNNLTTKQRKFCSVKCMNDYYNRIFDELNNITDMNRIDELKDKIKPASLPYNKEELQQLIDNHSYTELGRMYGISDNAVRKHMQRYGIELKQKKSMNDLSDIKDKEKLKEMIDKGSTKDVICKKYGCDLKTLNKYLKEFDISCKTSQEINADRLSKKVSQYDKDGEFLRSFNSVKEAEEYLGYEKGRTKISECCNGKRKSCLGYIWKYA